MDGLKLVCSGPGCRWCSSVVVEGLKSVAHTCASHHPSPELGAGIEPPALPLPPGCILREAVQRSTQKPHEESRQS